MKKILYKFAVPVFTLLIAIGAQAQTRLISTVAGTGTTGSSGDGGQATAAKLNNPSGIAVDDSGKLYIVDKSNAKIRRINRAGVITTIAGNGTYGYSGDNAAATAAELSPTGIAVDVARNIYIADGGNNVIRKINTAGIITTIAGTGSLAFGGDNGPATAAQLSGPAAVAVDVSGNVFVADEGNNVIRMINHTTGIITTVAGSGTGGLGDGGPATAGRLASPTGIAVDSLGNLYIVDQGNNLIRKVTAGGIISTYAGTGAVGYSGDGGAAVSAKLDYPNGIAIDDSGNVFIAEVTTNVIRKIDASGTITTVAGNAMVGYTGDGGLATAAKLNNPKAVAVDTSGKIYIADLGNNTIRKVAYPVISHVEVMPLTTTRGNITLLPNPSTGIFTVKGYLNSLNDEQVFLEVADMLGKVIYNNTTLAQKGIINTQIMLDDIPAGTYLMKVRAGTETNICRIVIIK